MKILLTLILIPLIGYSQFKIHGTIINQNNQQIILNKTDGISRQILTTSTSDDKGNFIIDVKEKYIGKLYLQYTNLNTVEFFSDNQNISLIIDNNKIKFTDSDINLASINYSEYSSKKDSLIPILETTLKYYQKDNENNFKNNLLNEINKLKSYPKPNLSKYPVLDFYLQNSQKYLMFQPTSAEQINQYLTDIRSLYVNSNKYLETTDLFKPILFSYLNYSSYGATSAEDSNQKIKKSINILIDEVNKETERGQLIQLAIIDILDSYGITQLSNEYLNEINNLKCEVIPSLQKKINTKNNLKVGNIIPNTIFGKNVLNTSQKSIHEVSSKYKMIVIWASYCPHCIREITMLKSKYEELKRIGVEIIGLSLDKDKNAYTEIVKDLPWINDAELLMKDSSYIEKYNVLATPTIFIVDQNNKIIVENPIQNELMNYFK